MLEFFKKKSQKSALKTAFKEGNKRKLQVHNFDTARTIGIIFCFKFEVDNKALLRLKKIIRDKGIDYKLVIYYPQEKLPENIISDPSNIYFSNKECNWFGKPATADINTFIKDEFDILIDLTVSDTFQTRYIATISKAMFKIGRVQYENDPYDFLLLVNSDDDEKFVQELEKYLPKFN